MIQPPLKFLHSELIELKLAESRKLSTEQLVDSLRRGKPGSLKTRSDGTVLDGHHRLQVLREREFDIDDLPREIMDRDSQEEQ